MAIHNDDKILVESLLEGNERAFDQFFTENYARLYRFALIRLSNDEDAAADVAQVALTRAVQKLHTYRGEATLFTWLCTICRNEASDWLRKQNRFREHIVLVEDFPEVQAMLDTLQIPDTLSPDAQYRREESLRIIQVAMDQLPAKYGDVLEWKYVEGYSVKEIAARMQIGTEAVQSLLARAKRAFASAYVTLGHAVHAHGS